jgi:hypothetical protein
MHLSLPLQPTGLSWKWGSGDMTGRKWAALMGHEWGDDVCFTHLVFIRGPQRGLVFNGASSGAIRSSVLAIMMPSAGPFAKGQDHKESFRTTKGWRNDLRV